MDPLGKSFGEYEVLSLIGEGGMGRVYWARHARLNREVALKLRQPGSTRDDEEIRRFQREARFMAAITHPNVVRIYDAGLADTTLWLAMELVDGRTFTDHLEASKRLPVPQAVAWMRDACRGIQALHDSGIAHRDLKPDNLMVTTDGVVKVMDFGLAKDAASTVLTAAGELIGTPAYLAPESLALKPTDHRIDLYQLGVILYLMVSGELPFEGETMQSYLQAVVDDPHIPIDRRVPGVPDSLKKVIDKALQKEPAQRPPSAGAMADALQAVADELESGQPARGIGAMLTRQLPALVPPRRSWRWAAAGIACGLALAGLTGIVGLRRPVPAPPSASAAAPGRALLERETEAAARAIRAVVSQEVPADRAAEPLGALHAGALGLPAPERPLELARAASRLIAADEEASFAAGFPKPMYFAHTPASARPLVDALAPAVGAAGVAEARVRLVRARLSDGPNALQVARAALSALRDLKAAGDAEATSTFAACAIEAAAVERAAGQLVTARTLFKDALANDPALAPRAVVPILEIDLELFRSEGGRYLESAKSTLAKHRALLAGWARSMATDPDRDRAAFAVRLGLKE